MDPATPAQGPLREKAKGKRRAIQPDEDDGVSKGDDLLLPSPSSLGLGRSMLGLARVYLISRWPLGPMILFERYRETWVVNIMNPHLPFLGPLIA